MIVLGIVGFLVGSYLMAVLVRFVGGALKPTLPPIEAPTRKIVVRRRIVQVESPSSQRTGAPADQKLLTV